MMVSARGLCLGLLVVLFPASSVLAQSGEGDDGDCALVDDNHHECSVEYPCYVEPGHEHGSAEVDHPEGCFSECPEPEHCSPEEESLSLAELIDVLDESVEASDPDLLWKLALQDDRVVYNTQRGAVQVRGCGEDSTVVAHYPLSDGSTLALDIHKEAS